jgi:hypothetical protein
MESLITAPARAPEAGDPIGALNRVALRDDAPALAPRGIVMVSTAAFRNAIDLVLCRAASSTSWWRSMATSAPAIWLTGIPKRWAEVPVEGFGVFLDIDTPQGAGGLAQIVEHDPEKWEPVFPSRQTPGVCAEITLKQGDHAQTKRRDLDPIQSNRIMIKGAYS